MNETKPDAVPRLRITTRPLANLKSLVDLADPADPLLWTKAGNGMVGRGTLMRFEFSGKNRFKDASALWREVLERAVVDDPLNLKTSGPVAFGSFTFDDDSAENSILAIPEILYGKEKDTSWVTRFEVLNGEENDWQPEPPPITPYGKSPDASFIEPPGEAAAYRSGVLEASAMIARGEAEKIVLARRLQAKVSAKTDLRAPLKNLAARYTDCWTFAVSGMLGASPETLIRSVSGEVSARVLAGTRKRYLDKQKDAEMPVELKKSKKELFEHKLAVLSLVDTVGPYVTDLKADEEPYILKLPNVWHLATNVNAKLASDATAIELAGAVHPTAAVAGTPTPVAIANIKELEPFDRGRYAGAVGWVGANGNGDWAIALRCAKVSSADENGEREVTAFAGGGLVAGSDPWHELTETVAKFRPIIEAFSAD